MDFSISPENSFKNEIQFLFSLENNWKNCWTVTANAKIIKPINCEESFDTNITIWEQNSKINNLAWLNETISKEITFSTKFKVVVQIVIDFKDFSKKIEKEKELITSNRRSQYFLNFFLYFIIFLIKS